MYKEYISSHQLMRRIKNSDHDAFKLLYERFWESMYSKAFSILGDKNFAKDIVQDVWISIWSRRSKIDNDNIEGYLLRAVRFKVYNEFRRSKYKKKLIEEFTQNYKANIKTNNIEQNIQLKDTEKSIYETIDSLPKRCKQVFELSRFDYMKNDEIAQKLNISQRTVETHISNALKVSVNSSAIKHPELVNELSNKFGCQCITVAIDAKQIDGHWKVYLVGGKVATDLNLFKWAKEVEQRGAGEILFTSMDNDGTKDGFANEALARLSEEINIPIIASGGAGNMQHFVDAFQIGKADAALAASVLHFGEIEILELKKELQNNNIEVRL